MVDGARCRCRAISRTPCFCAFRMANSSRSASDKYRAERIGADADSCEEGMPPHSRNHRVPTGCEMPADSAAASLEAPRAIAIQNGRRAARGTTDEHPGDRNVPCPVRSTHRLRFVVIALPVDRVLQRPIEFTQYLAIRYTDRLLEAGIDPSVGSRGDAYDNALAESINALYKAEVIYQEGTWKGLEDVEYATLAWVAWYNSQRLMEPIGYIPPAEYEEQYHRVQADQSAVALN